MTLIRTDRLVIRNFRPDDWPELQELVVSYQASEYAKCDHPWPTSSDGLAEVTESFAGDDRYLAVCLVVGGTLIGLVTLMPSEGAEREWSLGYVFHGDYHGYAFASEACRAVLRHAFDAQGAERVVAHTAAVNRPSCELPGRLGMTETRHFPAALQATAAGEPVVFVGVSFAVDRTA